MHSPTKRLKDVDTGDRLFLLNLAFRAGPVVMAVLLGVEYVFWGPRCIWFVIPDLAVTALFVLGINWIFSAIANGAGSILLPSGKSTPVAREYSEQESLIVRGHFAEAADSFRAIIEDDPTNIDARMRLGNLLEHHCKDITAAEREYRAVRRFRPDSNQDWVSSNALIDMFEQSGNIDGLRAELSGLVRRFRNTRSGESAARRLEELNQEHPVSRNEADVPSVKHVAEHEDVGHFSSNDIV